jgi:cytochrome bd-type quinol oxidase subunit 2
MNVASSYLSGLYRPTTFMRVGLILRGAAFDFRAGAKVWQAVSSPDSLRAAAIGVARPIIGGCTGFAYRVFRGKTIELDYA